MGSSVAPTGGPAANNAPTTNLPFAWQVRTFPYGLQYGPATGLGGVSGNLFLHGYLASADDGRTSPAIPQPRYQLHFLYNPSELTVTHSAQAANAVLPPYVRPDSGTPMVGTGGSLQFNLLYDRTYEVNQPNHPAYEVGVLYDLAVLNGLVGITTPRTQQGYASQGSDGSAPTGEKALAGPAAGADVVGALQMYPIWATFGFQRRLDNTGLFTSGLSVMKYFGFINSVTVTITHWTQAMVPDRCAIGINMTLMANNGYSVPF